MLCSSSRCNGRLPLLLPAGCLLLLCRDLLEEPLDEVLAVVVGLEPLKPAGPLLVTLGQAAPLHPLRVHLPHADQRLICLLTLVLLLLYEPAALGEADVERFHPNIQALAHVAAVDERVLRAILTVGYEELIVAVRRAIYLEDADHGNETVGIVPLLGVVCRLAVLVPSPVPLALRLLEALLLGPLHLLLQLLLHLVAGELGRSALQHAHEELPHFLAVLLVHLAQVPRKHACEETNLHVAFPLAFRLDEARRARDLFHLLEHLQRQR
mmetsp:Transcript_54871/g.127754  ORF Transcript_54871/g.127754 Transcript_54871/m.127754 type:complete len:268 (+) Transcript_54871:133-936(+)